MRYTGCPCENPRCLRINLPVRHLVTDDEQHFCDWFCHYEWEIANGLPSSYQIVSPASSEP
jgi:hypothetical protein